MHIDEHEFAYIEFVSPHNHFQTDCSVGIPKNIIIKLGGITANNIYIEFAKGTVSAALLRHYEQCVRAVRAAQARSKRAVGARAARGRNCVSEITTFIRMGSYIFL